MTQLMCCCYGRSACSYVLSPLIAQCMPMHADRHQRLRICIAQSIEPRQDRIQQCNCHATLLVPSDSGIDIDVVAQALCSAGPELPFACRVAKPELHLREVDDLIALMMKVQACASVDSVLGLGRMRNRLVNQPCWWRCHSERLGCTTCTTCDAERDRGVASLLGGGRALCNSSPCSSSHLW